MENYVKKNKGIINLVFEILREICSTKTVL